MLSIKPKVVDSSQFAAYLFYYYRQRNISLGMDTDNQFLGYLFTVARQAVIGEQLSVSARKAFLSNQISQFSLMIKELMIEAETATLERQRDILVATTKMHDEAKLCLSKRKKLENV